jgi:hypothetical protein
MKKINSYKAALIVLKYGVVQSVLTYILTPINTSGWVNLPNPERAFKVLIWTISIAFILALFQFMRCIWKKGDMKSRITVYIILTAIFLFFLYNWNSASYS